MSVGGRLSCKLVLFDRDGTLNVDRGYVWKSEDFDWLPDSREAIRWLNDRGIKVGIFTNQSGVARGFYSEADVDALHDWMRDELAKSGAHIDHFDFCPHHPEGLAPYDEPCDCRKPAPGMVRAALQIFDVNPEDALVVGDKDRDLEAGAAVGVRGVRYESGSVLDLVRESIEGLFV